MKMLMNYKPILFPLILFAFISLSVNYAARSANISLARESVLELETQQNLFLNSGLFSLAGIARSPLGGYVSVSLRGTANSQDLSMRSVSDTGETIWTKEYAQAGYVHSPLGVLVSGTGEIVLLEVLQTNGFSGLPVVEQLIRFDSRGEEVNRAQFDYVGTRLRFQKDGGNYLLAGLKRCNDTDSSECVAILTLSSNLQVVSELAIPKPRFAQDISSILRIPDGFVIGFTGEFRLMRVKTNNTVLWEQSFRSAPLPDGADRQEIRAILHAPDGGFLLGGFCAGAPGYDKTSDSYGRTDFWLVRIDANGNKLWDRSFGGTREEGIEWMFPTADGGYLIGGNSVGSGISGNKTVDGDGGWIVKISSAGIKEAELLLGPSLDAFLQMGEGFLAIGGTVTNAEQQIWSVPIRDRAKIRVRTKASGSESYNVDVSRDLTVWTGLVTGFSGSLELLEDLKAGSKFYRVSETP
jgi:hypothetical protein